MVHADRDAKDERWRSRFVARGAHVRVDLRRSRREV